MARTIFLRLGGKGEELFLSQGSLERDPQCGEYDGSPHRGQNLRLFEKSDRRLS